MDDDLTRKEREIQQHSDHVAKLLRRFSQTSEILCLIVANARHERRIGTRSPITLNLY